MSGSGGINSLLRLLNSYEHRGNCSFQDIPVTKDIRLYVSFLKENKDPLPDLSWKNSEGSFRIINKMEKTVFSILDLSASKTTDAMKALKISSEKYYHPKLGIL